MKRLTTILTLLFLAHLNQNLLADGKVMPPKNYKGSLEELAQEAIIVFQSGTEEKSAVEHMILKIRVHGEADNFAWVIPLPNEPTIKKENAELFKDCFDYVQARKRRPVKTPGAKMDNTRAGKEQDGVKVLSRQIVGDFDIAVVKETEANSLNGWLDSEGFQTLENAEDVLGFYREKDYVYACIKVSSEALASEKEIDSHPIRFTFETGGRDGIFFPMKLTGLQNERFDVNLYVFYSAWLNNDLNKFGFENRGFDLEWRDYDSPQCEANAGKNYSNPDSDPYLRSHKHRLNSVTSLMQKIAPGEKFYLTNIQARNLDPADVRDWSDDLWLFPHYTDKQMVPHDVYDGPASTAWPNETQYLAAAPAKKTKRQAFVVTWAFAAGAFLIFAYIFVLAKQRGHAGKG